MKIAIDVHHRYRCQEDDGVYFYFNGEKYTEAELSRKYADHLREILIQAGHQVYTNQPEMGILIGNYYQRHIQAIKEFKTDVYIACHVGYNDPSIAAGFVGYRNPESNLLSFYICEHLQKKIPEYKYISYKSTPKFNSYFYLNKYGVNVIIEPFLINYPSAINKFLQDGLDRLIAEGVAEGIREWGTTLYSD